MLIALTGGIAAGKSTVAALLAEYGATVVDADQLARDAVAPGTPGLAAVVAEFGPEVCTPDGHLDRPALAQRVFADEAARLRLEAIIHPEVRRLSAAAFAAGGADDPRRVVVYDVPLLAEARGHEEFDAVIVVEAPDETRIRRLVDIRGMAEADAASRIAAQATNAERRALADFVIDTSGTLSDTEKQTEAVWRSLMNQDTENR